MYICYFHLLRFKKERIFKKTKLSQIPFIISISFFDLSVENYYFFVIFFSLTFETWRKWKKAPQSIHLWQRFDSSKSHLLWDQPTRCDGDGRNLRICRTFQLSIQLANKTCKTGNDYCNQFKQRNNKVSLKKNSG